MKTHDIKGIIALAAAAAAVAGCGHRTPDFDACGYVDATDVTVSSESSGRIMRFDIKEGDRLVRGECIGHIDTVQIWLQKEELIRRKESAKVKTVDISCQTRAQYAQLENLRTELRRAEGLLEKNAGTQKNVDDLESQIRILEGQIAAAEQTYRQNNESVACEISTLDVQIAEAEDRLKKCRIYSPIDGTVLAKYAEEGETVSSGKPLFEIADMDDIYVRAYFSTAQLGGIHIGDKVKVIPDDGSRNPESCSGTVVWISREAEFSPKNIQTRDERADMVYAVKVAVEKDARLRLGMYAYIITD